MVTIRHLTKLANAVHVTGAHFLFNFAVAHIVRKRFSRFADIKYIVAGAIFGHSGFESGVHIAVANFSFSGYALFEEVIGIQAFT